METRGPNAIAIRTYERGVEDETLACGTGVVASALIFAATQNVLVADQRPGKGGDEMHVGFENAGDGFTNVTLTAGRLRVRRHGRGLMFRGTYTALVTPFRDGQSTRPPSRN